MQAVNCGGSVFRDNYKRSQQLSLCHIDLEELYPVHRHFYDIVKIFYISITGPSDSVWCVRPLPHMRRLNETCRSGPFFTELFEGFL